MIINRKVLETKPVVKESIDENFDMFSYSLSMVSEMNDTVALFTNTVFTEATGKKKIFDFEGIINAIIDAFINAIKRLFRKFLALLAQLASMGSSFEIELRAFKDKIKNFSGKVKVSDSMFYFTNLDESIPPSDVFESPKGLIARIDQQYSSKVNGGGLAPSELAKIEADLVVENEVNKFRNILLGARGTDAYAEFSKDCFKFFRSGNDYPMDSQVLDGRDIYNNYYLPYIDSKTEIRKVEKEKNRVEKIMNSIKGSIKKDYFKANLSYYSADIQSQIEQTTVNIQRKLCTIVDLNCQDLVLLYGQKLQAYKDFRLQCRRILIDTIKACIVQKGGQD